MNGKRILSPRTVEYMSAVHIPDTLPGRPVGEGFGLLHLFTSIGYERHLSVISSTL